VIDNCATASVFRSKWEFPDFLQIVELSGLLLLHNPFDQRNLSDVALFNDQSLFVHVDNRFGGVLNAK